MPDKEDKKVMWTFYDVILQIEGPFAAAIPKDHDEILSMLTHRMPSVEPPDATPINELADQVAEEVGAAEESMPGWSTFKKDEKGLYYEGRCIRGHVKDCALQIQGFFPAVKQFRAKVANKVYVVTDKIHLGKEEPDGVEQRFIQVMTRQGPRSSIKNIDYVTDPRLEFALKVLNDNLIKEDHLQAIFDYGSVHGLGQERSQGWGRYEFALTQREAEE